MNKLSFLLIALVILVGGCNENQKTAQKYSGDATYQQLSDEFLSGYLAWRPQLALSLGIHDYDGKITDYSKASLDAELARLKSYAQRFTAIDSSTLSPKIYYDLRIMLCSIQNEIFNFEDLQVYKYNPMSYCDPGGMVNGIPAMDLSLYIKRNFAPLEKRLRSIIAVEKQAPEIFAAARRNLADTLPRPFVENAIDIIKGSVDFLRNDLTLALKDVKNDSLMTAFKMSNNKAVEELLAFSYYLEKVKLPRATSHFAMGREKYQKMLMYDEMIPLSPKMILQIGLLELKREQERFNAAAKIINPNMNAVDVYNALEKEHPVADSLISDARKNAEAIRRFIINKNIVNIPSEAPINVKEMPEFDRAYTAMMDAPGPFETADTKSYYYITPVDQKWTAKQKEDWLEMYNKYTTDVVTIHEAYPGHYVQFLHLQASNASKSEKIFGSYAYIEGWAHYCEQMMLEEGFGNNGDPVTAAKYRLAQSGEALLRICRLCVSVKMHCEGMTVDEATKFFMDNWYQGEKPSRLEAMRGTYDPRYLFYTIGKLEILKLREDYKKQEGSGYSLEKFNDLILDNGEPPIRLLRELLLKDKNRWWNIL